MNLGAYPKLKNLSGYSCYFRNIVFTSLSFPISENYLYIRKNNSSIPNVGAKIFKAIDTAIDDGIYSSDRIASLCSGSYETAIDTKQECSELHFNIGIY